MSDSNDDRKPASAFPPGHFYSPIVDPGALADRRDALWPREPRVAGIDFNDEAHRRILTELFPRFIGDYDYPEQRADGACGHGFYTQNPQFTWLDARALFVLMRAWSPRRIIEVGAGYSSMLMADVNRRFLGGGTEIRCIDPYPPAFVRDLEGIAAVDVREVQRVPLATFRRLEAGDILFIDSSHVAKTGSDVNHLVFDVLPALAQGVRIHLHDIFLPGDYPPNWVLEENRSWNEQYVVRALLMYSTMFRVEFGSSYAFHAHLPLVQAALAHPKGHAFAGGSLWLTKVGAP